MKFNFSELKKKTLETADFITEKIPLSKEDIDEASKYIQDSATVAKKTISDITIKASDTIQDIREHETTKDFITKTNDFALNTKKEAEEYSSKALKTAKETKLSDVTESKPVQKLQSAIDQLKGKDKVGVAGESLATAGGVAAGTVAAGSLASAAGATTLLGSSTLAGVFGGIFVTTTPVGWIIGCAAVAGAAGYGITKLVRSGSEQDHVRKEIIERLNNRIQNIKIEEKNQNIFIELNQVLSVAIMSGLINEEQGKKMILLIEKGLLDPEIALKRIKDMAISTGVIELTHA
jgi:hypothetical protein